MDQDRTPHHPRDLLATGHESQPTSLSASHWMADSPSQRPESGGFPVDQNEAASLHRCLTRQNLVEAVTSEELHPFDRAFDDPDRPRYQLGAFGAGQGSRFGEVDDVVGPLADYLCVADGLR